MGVHNNQPKVGIDGGRGIEEERRPGWKVCGGLLSLCLERKINKEIKQQQKYVMALDGHQRMKITQ